MYHIKMDGSEISLTEMSDAEIQNKSKKTESVSVKLSKNILNKMKRYAGIKNQTSSNAILYAFITKSLDDAQV